MNRGQKSEGETRFERRLVLNRTRAFRSPLYFCSFSLSFLYSSTFTSASSHRHTPLPSSPYHPFRRFCPPPRGTINFLDLNPGLRATTTTTHDHRPLPLLWCVYVRIARQAWKCGLYRLHAPLFTGPTTYLRGLGAPRSNLDIRLNSLRHSRCIPHTSISRLASFPWGETYQTLSPFLPFLFLFPYLSRRA